MLVDGSFFFWQVGVGKERTDLGVNVFELILDSCELLVGDLGDLFGLFRHVWLCGFGLQRETGYIGRLGMIGEERL